MFFEFRGERYEAWIETTSDKNKLNEYNEESKSSPGQYPQLECYAECVDGTEFAVIVRKSGPGPKSTAFEAIMKINGFNIYGYAWREADRTVRWDSMYTKDSSTALSFSPMEDCFDPAEQPKDLTTVGVIEVELQPGSLAYSGINKSAEVSKTPTQKAKPLHSKLSSTVVASGQPKPRVPMHAYTFTAEDLRKDPPRIRLRWKYATRLKLVAKDIIDDPALKATIPKSPPPAPLLKRKRPARSTTPPTDDDDEADDGKDEKKNVIRQLQKRLKAAEDEAKRFRAEKITGATTNNAIDLTETDD